jgi:hypothetical protein
MNFWLRNVILGAFLVILAWAFLANQDFLLSLDHPENQLTTEEASSEGTSNTDSLKQEVKVKQKKKENAAALGLSSFYAKLYGDMGDDKPKIRNNIIYLPDPKGNLEQLLQAREMIVRPYRKNWHGSTESRPFRKGETIYQKLAEYSKNDGIELIWWLNRDYIVKDPFRIEKNILKTAYQVGKAVEGHFESGLSIYFCYRHRAVVIIESMPRAFLDEECTLLKADASY